MLVGFLTTSCHAESGPPTFVIADVTGRGSTEDAAFKQAVVEAVRSVVGTLVTAENVVANDQVIQDKVLTLSNGFVEKVLEQKKRQITDGTYEVALKCIIRKGQLYGSLKNAKVPTMKFDGISLFADAVSQVDFKKNAVENLQAAFEKFYDDFPLLYEFAPSKPKLGDTANGTTDVTIDFAYTVNSKRYYEDIAPAFCTVLESASGEHPITFTVCPHYYGDEHLPKSPSVERSDILLIQTGIEEWKAYKIDKLILKEVGFLQQLRQTGLIGLETVCVFCMDSDGNPIWVSDLLPNIWPGILDYEGNIISAPPLLHKDVTRTLTMKIPTKLLPLITKIKVLLARQGEPQLVKWPYSDSAWLHQYLQDGIWMCKWGAQFKVQKGRISGCHGQNVVYLGTTVKLKETVTSE